MTHNQIALGGYTFTDEEISTGSCYIGNSIAGDELAIDTLTVEAHNEDTGLVAAPYGTPVTYHHDGALVGKFYLQDVKRVGKVLYQINCISAVGLLDADTHYGGLYTGETVLAVLEDIVGGTVPFTVADSVKLARVYGWLPVATRRDNLRQLLFSVGAALRKDVAGEIKIEFLDVEEPSEISDDRLALEGTVEYPATVSRVAVLEHSYFSTPLDEEVTLYDDAVISQGLISPKGVSFSGALVTFDAPVYDLAIQGGTVLESGVNYAVLSPSGQATLTGKKYTHTAREVHATPKGVTDIARNVARVENATLVNLTNSESVAARVAAYYSASRSVETDLLVGPERPGAAVLFRDPFGDRAVALLASLEMNMSRLLTARANLIVGYIPANDGVYENVAVLTGAGNWTPPEGTKRIRVVLIGGGFGGSSGFRGADGSDGTAISSSSEVTASTSASRGYGIGRPGEGGEPGEPGLGGRILQATVEIVGGEVFAYTTGVGGAGGVPVDEGIQEGAEGTPSVFGDFTSADGSPSEFGFTDLITGEAYAVRGEPGIAGGRGNGWDGQTETTSLTITPGETVTGPDGTVWVPGADNLERASASYTTNKGGSWARTTYAYSDCSSAGGPAAGTNGGDAVSQGEVYAQGITATSSGGQGGPGGNAVAPAKRTGYGFGGNAGHGGGGGGGGPANWTTVRQSKVNVPDGTFVFRAQPSLPGVGGAGSTGGEGGDGCILVYY